MSPSFASSRSTTFCVAMPAWSVPGSQSARRPRIRSNRTSTSCTVLLRPWPMCSTAVTLGGGIMIDVRRRPVGAGSGENKPRSCHQA